MRAAFLSGRVSSPPKPSPRSLPSSSPCPRPSRKSRPRRLVRASRECQVNRTNLEEGADNYGANGEPGCQSDAGAAGLPDDVADAAAPLVRPEQNRHEGGL